MAPFFAAGALLDDAGDGKSGTFHTLTYSQPHTKLVNLWNVPDFPDFPNPSSQSISVNPALVGQDGNVLDDGITMTLGPGQQSARYLWQDLARVDFKGSLVLRGQAGAMFIAVALSEKQGLLTVIPLIPGKAPGVPN